MSFQNCSEITPACPVQSTTYGYVPNYAVNMTLLVIFGTAGALQLVLGVFFRSWSFMVAVAGGCFMELVGYVGRLQMHANVWNQGAFRQQIVCLILAPALIAAGIYLSLKHIILYLGPEHSRLQPKYYTWLFISCDIFSIAVQAAGGGIEGAAGTDDKKLLSTGNNLMIAGLAIQVVTMSLCGGLAVDFAIRYRRGVRLRPGDERAGVAGRTADISHTKFQLFCLAEVVAYVAVLIRCIYRIPEMAGGWGNSLMQNETEFFILDGMMIALASITFTLFHPGFWFPPMTGRWKTRAKRVDVNELIARE